MVIIALSRGFSLMTGLILTGILAGGSAILTSISRIPPPEEALEPDVYHRVNSLMKEIKPVCNQIFDRNLDTLLQPLETDLQREFSRGLAWLWDEVDEFYDKVDKAAQQGRAIFQLIDVLKEDKVKMVRKLQGDIHLILTAVQEMQNWREREQSEVNRWVNDKTTDFRHSLDKEKQYFYDHVYRMLVEQARQTADDEDMLEFFDVNKLGQQFGAIMNKSLTKRLENFQQSLVMDLENYSAEVVGRMQASTTQVFNLFGEVNTILGLLLQTSRSEGGVLLRRLEGYQSNIKKLEEQANEILVTLAWQDVMVTRRWQDIQEHLYLIKDKVAASVDETVNEYITGVLEEEIPGLAAMPRDSGTVSFYKALLDAELVYQVYSGNKLPDVIGNGVYSLLQFVRPLEVLASQSIQMTNEALHHLQGSKALIKNNSYRNQFDKVKAALLAHQPDAAPWLENIFPRQFYQFATSPHLKPRPDNLSQAAWSLFTLALIDDKVNQDIYLLIGLLLMVHQIRARHIHPFKNTPFDIEDPALAAAVRSACYKAVSIFLQTSMRGISPLAGKV